jgi:hypothetical protein
MAAMYKTPWPVRRKCERCGAVKKYAPHEPREALWEAHLCAACDGENEREAAAFRHEFRPGTFGRWLSDQESKPANEVVVLIFRLILAIGAVVVISHFVVKYW